MNKLISRKVGASKAENLMMSSLNAMRMKRKEREPVKGRTVSHKAALIERSRRMMAAIEVRNLSLKSIALNRHFSFLMEVRSLLR